MTGAALPAAAGTEASPAATKAASATEQPQSVEPAADPSTEQPKPLDVRLADPDASGYVALLVGGADVQDVAVDIRTTGAVTVDDESLRIPSDDAGRASGSVDIEVAEHGVGIVRASAHQGKGGDGVRNAGAAVLWVTRTADGSIVSSSDSELAVRQERLQADRPALTAENAAGLAMEEITAAADVQVSDAGGAFLAADTPSGDTEVTGTVTYHDAGYRAAPDEDEPDHVHPARDVEVIAMDSNGAEVARTTVSNSGFYRLVLRTNPPDFLVRVNAQSDHAEIGEEHCCGLFTGPYSVQSNFFLDEPPGTARSRDFEIGSTGPAATAFAIHDAVVTASRYAEDVRNESMDQITVDYPDGERGSRAGGGEMHVGERDWSDWDVITHEYGHLVDHEIDASNMPGGDHCVGDNLWIEACGDPGYGKERGTELAWSEGFATAFGQIAQSEQAADDSSTPAIPGDPDAPTINGVGDARYQNSDEDSSGNDGGRGFEYPIEPSGADNEGEDNEIAVIRTLWDVYDAHDDEGDSLSMGDHQLFGIIDQTNAARLSDIVQVLNPDSTTKPMTGEDEDSLGCVLSDQGVAPSWPTSSVNATLSEPPTLTWAAGNEMGSGDDEHANGRFRVEAFVPGSFSAYWTSEELTDTEWTPSRLDWDRMSRGRGDAVHLRLVGWQDDDPRTGPFTGCALAVNMTASAVDNATACADVTLPANDDGSTGAVDLPFPVNFFGTTYSYLFVNNNGNVTFRDPMGTYTPFAITGSSPPLIAPFFADVDTRAGSAPVTYSYGTTTYAGRRAFCVNWINVGYYSGHTDKLNSFQLLLVDRAERGVGDFDMVFNYDSVQWETGDASGGSGGFGGTPAAVGFSAGTGEEGSFFQLPGSLTTGALVDGGSRSLAGHSANSLMTGRYVYPVRNGRPPTGTAEISGHVGSDEPASLWPVVDAPVQVCPSAGGACAYLTRSDDNGAYTASGLLPGTYDVKAFPPPLNDARPATVRSVEVAAGDRQTVDLVLDTTNMPAPGTTITPSNDLGGVPVVNWQDQLTLTTHGCPGGSASYEILDDGFRTIASGSLAEVSSGAFTATVPPLYPAHGYAHVILVIVCPDGTPDQSTGFDIYIDPSGVVVDTSGDPVADATVTLLRSDTEGGPFDAVPNGSDVMSPANRTNPMHSDGAGRFGWDVITGWYKVSAERTGCHLPGDASTAAVLSDAMYIPPEVTDLRLVLDCGPTTPPAVTVDGVSDALLGSADAGTELTFHADQAGTFRASVGGTTCSNGNEVAAGTYAAPDPRVLTLSATALAEGDNTVRVCVTNRGRTGEATTLVVKDTVAPVVTITSSPSGTTDSRTAHVVFTVEGASSYTCSVDSGDPVGCASPLDLTGLDAGRHGVAVRAVDAAGNAGSAVSEWTVQAPTTLTYDGDMLRSTSAGAIVAAATLRSWSTSCAVGQPVTFTLDRSPVSTSTSPYALGAGMTDAGGRASATTASTSGWAEGVYTVTAAFAGTATCAASTDNATLTVAAPGVGAIGGGTYSTPAIGRVDAGFFVRKSSSGAYRGAVGLVNHHRWRLLGVLGSYSRSGTTGTASGVGALTVWDPTLKSGSGGWGKSVAVPFVISFADKGSGPSAPPDTFGIKITYTPKSGQPPLPNSAPLPLTRGAVVVT